MLSLRHALSSAALVLALLPVLSGGAVHADVNISNVVRTWVPADVTVTVGESVHWSWTSLHNVAQVNGPANNSWNGSGFYSGAATNGGVFSHTFTTPGLFYYVCELHAGMGMRGTVTVLNPCADPTPPAPQVQITYDPATHNVTLSWDAVTESLEGCPLTVDYRVLGGPTPGELAEIAFTSQLSIELPVAGNSFFRVIALPVSPAR
ncbi:MAG: plastocyanin/azurin family copper-binding protein [Candidatus Delongbacteria bacterium]